MFCAASRRTRAAVRFPTASTWSRAAVVFYAAWTGTRAAQSHLMLSLLLLTHEAFGLPVLWMALIIMWNYWKQERETQDNDKNIDIATVTLMREVVGFGVMGSSLSIVRTTVLRLQQTKKWSEIFPYA
jgi:uncharacterized membrane protein (DUF4010 family)